MTKVLPFYGVQPPTPSRSRETEPLQTGYHLQILLQRYF